MRIRVRYLAGYVPGKAPADLASACLELAAWNMARYKGRRIGLTGNVRGSGKDGEHLETSMPENVPETPTYSVHTIFREHGLSERETEVAHLIVMEGLSNQKIAERIFRSKFTVEKHVTSIYRKFGVPDRTAFVAKVLR
jgi:DNA-binding NarL/FixJ family response regulator